MKQEVESPLNRIMIIYNRKGHSAFAVFIVRPRACFHCEVFRVPKNETLKTNKPPAMQVSQHCFSLQ